MHDAIIRIRDVRTRTGLSGSTIRRLVRAGLFPAPVLLAERAQGWRLSSIDQWIADRQTIAPSAGGDRCAA